MTTANDVTPVYESDLPHAETAYRRYASITNGLNHRGEPMPEFKDLGGDITRAWCHAAGSAHRDGYDRGYKAGVNDTRVETFCGKVNGAEVCDRMKEHNGDCSWHSDIIVANMARQINELYTFVQAAKQMVPPGMLPPGV